LPWLAAARLECLIGGLDLDYLRLLADCIVQGSGPGRVGRIFADPSPRAGAALGGAGAGIDTG
jgi:hypothetical protein